MVCVGLYHFLIHGKGIGGEFGCISTAMPLLSKPSETTVVSEETRHLLSRFDEDTKLPRVKVCSLLSLNFSDLISEVQPDVQNLQHISQCLRQATSPCLIPHIDTKRVDLPSFHDCKAVTHSLHLRSGLKIFKACSPRDFQVQLASHASPCVAQQPAPCRSPLKRHSLS